MIRRFFAMLRALPRLPLLAILVLVLALVAWSWWKGWSLPEFRGARFEYSNGATLLEEVREIGQLVSARYYGEVIHSYLEHQETEDWELLTLLYDEVKRMYSRHYQSAKDMPIRRSEAQIRLDAYNRFLQNANTLSEREWFQEVLLKVTENPAACLEQIRTSSWEAFSRQHGDALLRLRRLYRQEKLYNPSLVYLGRGEVLMGYDLTQLDSLHLLRRSDSLILEMDPLVISADINPWYRPPADGQPGVPGFEAVRESGNITQQMIQQVKAGCKTDLLREAHRHGIVALAERSAEETLLGFFRLLSPPGDTLRVVDIRHSQRWQAIDQWTLDQKIDGAEWIAISDAARNDSLSHTWLPLISQRIGTWGQTLEWNLMR